MKLLAAVKRMHEENPMLGLRGVRLGIVIPGLFTMQARAILEAAAARHRRPAATRSPEIMIPLVGAVQELELVKTDIIDVARDGRSEETGVELTFKVGTMIELPRAAHDRGRDRRGGGVLLVRHQRPHPDDVGVLPRRRRGVVLLDVPREGDLRGVAVRDPRPRGRRARWSGRRSSRAGATRPDLHLGVCGEHGGDPDSIHFFEEVGLDYVSCSPFRVPVARLEAGRAVASQSTGRLSGAGAED